MYLESADDHQDIPRILEQALSGRNTCPPSLRVYNIIKHNLRMTASFKEMLHVPAKWKLEQKKLIVSTFSLYALESDYDADDSYDNCEH